MAIRTSPWSAAWAIRLYPGDASFERLAGDAAQRVSDRAPLGAMLEELVSVKESAVLRVALARVALMNDRAAALANVRRALDAVNQEPNACCASSVASPRIVR